MKLATSTNLAAPATGSGPAQLTGAGVVRDAHPTAVGEPDAAPSNSSFSHTDPAQVPTPAPALGRISLPQFPDSSLLTHSSEKAWHACHRRYYFAYVLGVRKANASEPLRIGSMWHLGVGAYEAGESIDDVENMIRRAYADQGCPSCLAPEEFALEEEKVVAMVRGHHAQYAADAILKSVAIEKPFALPIINPETGRPTPNFTDAGMIDRIAELPDGTFCLVERKTTSESIAPDSPYWMALRNDPQISRYFLAAQALGFDVTKIVYDVIKKPMIRPRQITKAEQAYANAHGDYCGMKITGPCPDRETPKMYGARLLADLKARPEFYFARNEIARLDSDLDEFKQDLWDTQKDIAAANLRGRYVRNASSCLEPFQCEYLEVCGDLSANHELIPDGFRRAKRLHEEIRTESPALATETV